MGGPKNYRHKHTASAGGKGDVGRMFDAFDKERKFDPFGADAPPMLLDMKAGMETILSLHNYHEIRSLCGVLGLEGDGTNQERSKQVLEHIRAGGINAEKRFIEVVKVVWEGLLFEYLRTIGQPLHKRNADPRNHVLRYWRRSLLDPSGGGRNFVPFYMERKCHVRTNIIAVDKDIADIRQGLMVRESKVKDVEVKVRKEHDYRNVLQMLASSRDLHHTAIRNVEYLANEVEMLRARLSHTTRSCEILEEQLDELEAKYEVVVGTYVQRAALDCTMADVIWGMMGQAVNSSVEAQQLACNFLHDMNAGPRFTFNSSDDEEHDNDHVRGGGGDIRSAVNHGDHHHHDDDGGEQHFSHHAFETHHDHQGQHQQEGAGEEKEQERQQQKERPQTALSHAKGVSRSVRFSRGSTGGSMNFAGYVDEVVVDNDDDDDDEGKGGGGGGGNGGGGDGDDDEASIADDASSSLSTITFDEAHAKADRDDMDGTGTVELRGGIDSFLSESSYKSGGGGGGAMRNTGWGEVDEIGATSPSPLPHASEGGVIGNVFSSEQTTKEPVLVLLRKIRAKHVTATRRYDHRIHNLLTEQKRLQEDSRQLQTYSDEQTKCAEETRRKLDDLQIQYDLLEQSSTEALTAEKEKNEQLWNDLTAANELRDQTLKACVPVLLAVIRRFDSSSERLGLDLLTGLMVDKKEYMHVMYSKGMYRAELESYANELIERQRDEERREKVERAKAKGGPRGRSRTPKSRGKSLTGGGSRSPKGRGKGGSGSGTRGGGGSGKKNKSKSGKKSTSRSRSGGKSRSKSAGRTRGKGAASKSPSPSPSNGKATSKSPDKKMNSRPASGGGGKKSKSPARSKTDAADGRGGGGGGGGGGAKSPKGSPSPSSAKKKGNKGGAGGREVLGSPARPASPSKSSSSKTKTVK